MQNLSHIEISEICNQLGNSYPKSIRKIFGGNIHETWQIEFENERFFLKRNIRKKEFLKFEEYCLRKLNDNIDSDNLIIPKVVSYLKVQEVELLLMDWIDMYNGDQKKLGKGLGEMHLQSNQYNPEKFGFPIEGFIGTNKQIEGWSNSWVECFINLRIKPQLSILGNNFIDFQIKNKIYEKIESELNKHKPINSLIHGDLWSGNIGIDHNGKGVIFDPASWWADHEVDLAMTRLFGGFNEEFYEEYNKIIPIKDSFEKRVIIYNFYHVLNHANMFGGSYFYQVQDYIRKIISL